MKHKDGLDIAALLLLLLVAIAAMAVPVALTQPALLAVPAVLVLIALCVVLYQRRRLRAFLARQLCSTDFENSRIQYSLANLPIPTVLVNDGRILWYNQYFRQDVLNDYDAVTRPVNRVLPELDLAVCSRPHGQDLKVGERRFTAYAGSAKGSRGASLVYLINDTLYKETLDEYNESRPACLIIVIDSYDELFDDMKDSEQAKELEAINSLLERYIGRSTGFLRKVTNSRYIAVVEESAGILFTMLAALRLKRSWMYRKIQVLAIFDDLDTILLMIPLQILMIGLRWQLFVVVVIVFLLLWLGWKKLSTYELRQDWWAILTYSVVVFGVTQLVYLLSKYYFGEEGSIHIEVLLPAFVLGMVMKTRHVESRGERMAASGISFLFMFLVGLSMPLFIGMTAATGEAASSVTGSQPMMSWGVIAFHVVIVSLLSNLGKLFPMFFYRDRKLSERLALSIGMFTRGEVGAGVIFIALGYSLGGPALVISVLTLVLNLVLTGIFVVWVKKLALRTYAPEEFDAVSTIR